MKKVKGESFYSFDDLLSNDLKNAEFSKVFYKEYLKSN